jgi:hypothetical protein
LLLPCITSDDSGSNKSSEATPPDAASVEAAAVATSSEGISENSSETKLSEKTSEWEELFSFQSLWVEFSAKFCTLAKSC